MSDSEHDKEVRRRAYARTRALGLCGKRGCDVYTGGVAFCLKHRRKMDQALSEAARKRQRVVSRRWMLVNLANGQCGKCTAMRDDSVSVRLCPRHLLQKRRNQSRARMRRTYAQGN